MRIGGKGQGLPMHVIVVIMLGIIILAVIMMYLFGVFGEGGRQSINALNISKNVADNASGTVKGFFG